MEEDKLYRGDKIETFSMQDNIQRRERRQINKRLKVDEVIGDKFQAQLATFSRYHSKQTKEK